MSRPIRIWPLLLLCVFALPCFAGTSRKAKPEEISDANKVLLACQASAAKRREAAQLNFPWGLPVPTAKLTHKTVLLCQPALVQLYDHDLNVPLWVGYRLPENNAHQGPRPDVSRVEGFRADPRLSGSDPVTEREYAVPFVTQADGKRRAVYDRGHMAPNADFPLDLWAMVNSFVMTNMCPQIGGFNGGIWKDLETLVRAWSAKRDFLYVTTGAIFMPEPGKPLQYTWMGTRGRVAVPTHFYKVLVSGRGDDLEALAFVLPHLKKTAGLSSAVALRSKLAPVDEVERLSGFNLLAGLPDPVERALEAHKPTQLWQ